MSVRKVPATGGLSSIAEETAAPPAAGPSGRLGSGIGSQLRLVLRTARPRQMVKNLMVLAAPFAAGELWRPQVLARAAIAVIAFSAAAAGVYLLNDVIDASADRVHPTKRLRPVAAGLLRPRRVIVASLLLLAVGESTAVLGSVKLGAVTAVYIPLQILYCLWLRSQPVVDICLVSVGFVLRLIAGAEATGVPVAFWLIYVTAFGSLFVVSGRRYSEMALLDQVEGTSRVTLERYSSSYLRFVWSGSAIISIVAYLLWSAENLPHTKSLYSGLAAMVFVIAILRYALDVDHGSAGAPEDIALRDRTLQMLGLVWLVATSVAVYS